VSAVDLTQERVVIAYVKIPVEIGEKVLYFYRTGIPIWHPSSVHENTNTAITEN
jgi:hypothetical protein